MFTESPKSGLQTCIDLIGYWNSEFGLSTYSNAALILWRLLFNDRIRKIDLRNYSIQDLQIRLSDPTNRSNCLPDKTTMGSRKENK